VSSASQTMGQASQSPKMSRLMGNKADVATGYKCRLPSLRTRAYLTMFLAVNWRTRYSLLISLAEIHYCLQDQCFEDGIQTLTEGR